MHVTAEQIRQEEQRLASQKPTLGRPWCRGEVFTPQPGDLFILRYATHLLTHEEALAMLAALELPEHIHARCLPMGALDIEIYRQDASNGTPKPNS